MGRKREGGKRERGREGRKRERRRVGRNKEGRQEERQGGTDEEKDCEPSHHRTNQPLHQVM